MEFTGKNIVNLTVHDINIYTVGGIVTLKRANLPVPRKTEDRYFDNHALIVGSDDKVHNIPVNRLEYDTVVAMPEKQKDTLFVVSRVIAESLPDRGDLLIVDAIVRDGDGTRIGCKALAFIVKE